jgi:hypothetical protein
LGSFVFRQVFFTGLEDFLGRTSSQFENIINLPFAFAFFVFLFLDFGDGAKEGIGGVIGFGFWGVVGIDFFGQFLEEVGLDFVGGLTEFGEEIFLNGFSVSDLLSF